MARILVTGSTDGLGRAAARSLVDAGHAVVLHARSPGRAEAVADLAPRAAGCLVGDLSSREQVLRMAAAANALGPFDAVVHNAGVYAKERGRTPEGWPTTLAVNVLAPYLLTARIDRPGRLVYLSSGMHRAGSDSLQDIGWERRPWNTAQAYSDSKLFVTALALALARLWPTTASHAVDPGWVPTKMGGRSAPDDLQQGHETQAWLATSDDDAVRASGGYWHHRRRGPPARAATSTHFQDRLLERLAALTGVGLAQGEGGAAAGGNA